MNLRGHEVKLVKVGDDARLRVDGEVLGHVVIGKTADGVRYLQLGVYADNVDMPGGHLQPTHSYNMKWKRDVGEDGIVWVRKQLEGS